MPARFSAFGRVFSPSWPMTLATVVLLGLLPDPGPLAVASRRGQTIRLGRVRAERRRGTAGLPEFRRAFRDSARISLSGTFIHDQQFLLDNRSHQGRPGWEVLTPLALDDGRLILVNRGWIPFSGDRTRLPDVAGRRALVHSAAASMNSPAAASRAVTRAPQPAEDVAQGHELSNAGGARSVDRQKDRPAHSPAGSGCARWLRARMEAPGPRSRAPFLIRHPVVGFCRWCCS